MQLDNLGDRESAYADLSQYKRLSMPIRQREKTDTVIDTSRHIYSSNRSSQFRVPPVLRLTVQFVEQIQQNGSHSVPGSYPSHRSPQFRVAATPFPDVPPTPRPNIPTTPPIGAPQLRVPATPFPDVPVTPIPGSPSLERKEREFTINRQPLISPQLRLPSRKAEVPITEQPPDVHAAFPLTLPSMPLPASSEQQAQSLSLAHQHPAIDDYALSSQKVSTIASLVALLIALTLISGLADAQGFIHASNVWLNGKLIWAEVIQSALGFGIGIVAYWMCIRFLQDFSIISPEIQTVGWFTTTIIGVAMFSGKFLHWQIVDQMVGMAVLLGVVWLLARSAGKPT
jgi:hypothetical protein